MDRKAIGGGCLMCLNIDDLNVLWASLSKESREHLVRTYVLTGVEARDVLGVSSARLSTLIGQNKLIPVKRDSSATLFLREDVERRAEEAKILRKKFRG